MTLIIAKVFYRQYMKDSLLKTAQFVDSYAGPTTKHLCFEESVWSWFLNMVSYCLATRRVTNETVSSWMDAVGGLA